MKQKIVIRVVSMNGGRSKTLRTVVALVGVSGLLTSFAAKDRSKTLRTVVGVSGVESAAIKGDQVEVVGDGVDAVVLTRALRKKVAPADLISVEEHKKKEEKKDDKLPPVFFPQYLYPIPMYEVRHPSPDPCCTTMTTVMCLLCMPVEIL